MVKNGKWCPLGCGKCVMSSTFGCNPSWRCLRCGSEFTLDELGD